ncbi:MAG: hypothetical protein QME44_01730 [Thermodesulfobacteriota bacterium]|nr:hypothetical protein [Thermodesulfobacteriota bacterium]
MNYLELCQKARRECGIQGSGPTTVIGQVGILQKLVDWIADADEEICSRWFDWNFLWTSHSASTIAGIATYIKPADLGVWDPKSFYLDYTLATYSLLSELEYRHWRDSYRNGVKTNARPSHFVRKPSGDIILEAPPDAIYTLTADYWKTITRISANASATLIPDRFQRVIIARAKMFFAEDQNAPEIMQSSVQEYNELMDKLEAAELPNQHNRRLSQAEADSMDVIVE